MRHIQALSPTGRAHAAHLKHSVWAVSRARCLHTYLHDKPRRRVLSLLRRASSARQTESVSPVSRTQAAAQAQVRAELPAAARRAPPPVPLPTHRSGAAGTSPSGGGREPRGSAGGRTLPQRAAAAGKFAAPPPSLSASPPRPSGPAPRASGRRHSAERPRRRRLSAAAVGGGFEAARSGRCRGRYRRPHARRSPLTSLGHPHARPRPPHRRAVTHRAAGRKNRRGHRPAPALTVVVAAPPLRARGPPTAAPGGTGGPSGSRRERGAPRVSASRRRSSGSGSAGTSAPGTGPAEGRVTREAPARPR